MKFLKYLALASFAALCLTMSAPKADAQVAVNIGPAPECPYGYYDYAPYACAPYGYYGPEWFANGIFIGVGPWFHGREDFRGHVNNRFDPHHGYHGYMPARGEKRDERNRVDHMEHFRGNEMRDGRGHGGKR